MDDFTKTNNLRALWESSYLAGGNAPYIEYLYDCFLHDPASIDPAWVSFFETLSAPGDNAIDISHADIRDQFRHLVQHRSRGRAQPTSPPDQIEKVAKQIRVLQLITAYRVRGHQIAEFDPLGLRAPAEIPDLRLHHHGLGDMDLDTEFETGSLVAPDRASLRDILDILTRTYCKNVGSEYMHITDTEEKRWFQNKLESVCCELRFSTETRLRLMEQLTGAEGMERYLHTRYVGQKRFSLEGAENLIVILDELIQRGGNQGVKEIVIGMAHRGRLNVLVNIMGKTPAELFQEFEGKKQFENASGDVKYHMGFSSDINTENGPVHVALAFNPSHLEIVGPVVEGSVRARQERRNDVDGSQVVPVLLHGDAAFAGQGVIMETFNMSQSRGYSTKGTIHIIINNQIGFTTSNQQDARSTLYSSDVAKMVNAPIFHVNGDDPEAVLFVTQLALDYRMNFRKDIVIDLVCYRRHGHSEADEPSATQPMMYKKIKQKKTARELYANKLIEEGLLAPEEPEQYLEKYRAALDTGDSVVSELLDDKSAYHFSGDWESFTNIECSIAVETKISLDELRELYGRLDIMPESFELHPSVSKILNNRRKMAAGALPIDWGFAETMAYATLINHGFGVRLSGEDCGRGTFFHRHAVLYNQKDGESYIPLRHLAEDQPNFLVINSLLSEEAVLAFEYGYATTRPNTLTIWEAQFGDFANNAQVVIDQFISGGEQKWSRVCSLVMLLPHGYEGQGPEHSSARLERYLQLCAEYNMQVCVPTTPSQIFHLLRRQMLLNCRKPLVVMSPKSLLRHRQAVSTLEDLTAGSFMKVIPEVDDMVDSDIKRVIMCSGKVFYDLLERRQKEGIKDATIIRIEQLYPFPEKELEKELARYPDAEKFVWCQEEPKNQGAWFTSQHHMRTIIGDRGYLDYAGRPFSAAPAVGSHALHIKQQQQLVADALAL